MLRSRCCLGPLLVALVAACAAGPALPPAATGPHAAPPLERAVAVCDGRTGEPLAFDELLDELADADVVFLGEQHTDETTHRVELAVFQGLLARRGEVVLALEMFERDVQPALDAYLAGELSEPEFLERARPWSNYREGYRRLVEHARSAGAPVVASNFPAPLRRRVAMEGAGVLAELPPEEAAFVPAELFANSPEYWRRVDNAIRGHVGMMGGPADPDDPRLTSTQSLWDNSMGESCALALERHPSALVLHVNGGFHSAYWDGTVRQLLLREPDAKVRTVDIVPVPNPAVARPSGEPEADFVVYAEERASDRYEGRYAVQVPRASRYRLHLPETASEEVPVPLLVWLGEDGLTARDGIALWRGRLGEEAAIAALEPTWRERGEDLGDAGRWYWTDDFPADIGAGATAVERAIGYLVRNLPVDAERVVVAGEGTGATVVAATALFTDLPVTALAFEPRQFAKLKDFPLPLPELRGDAPPVEKHLSVTVPTPDREWWEDELAQYTGIGLANELVAAPESPWEGDASRESALRAALGLEARTAEATGLRRAVLVPDATPRALLWARLLAQRTSGDGQGPVAVLETDELPVGVVPVSTTVRADDFREARELPRCPGPFGGTTLVVLPSDVSPSELAAWEALVEDDPLAKESRFRRLRIARRGASPTVGEVLDTLASENRTNVLLVPAEFCATGETMRDLARQVGDRADRMTLHWLPGLGGQ